jgi:hypothetical protein
MENQGKCGRNRGNMRESVGGVDGTLGEVFEE